MSTSSSLLKKKIVQNPRRCEYCWGVYIMGQINSIQVTCTFKNPINVKLRWLSRQSALERNMPQIPCRFKNCNLRFPPSFSTRNLKSSCIVSWQHKTISWILFFLLHSISIPFSVFCKFDCCDIEPQPHFGLTCMPSVVTAWRFSYFCNSFVL